LTRRDLVVVRAGDDSLHRRWLRDPVERSWDLVVSYFGDDPDKFREPDCVRIDGKGPKWPALQTLLRSQPDLLCGYDYVWLPDDDIDCRADDINRLFAAARHYRLLLSQPALTPRSHFSWAVTLQHPFARIRFTNFVEIMVPCLEREFLTRLVPTMGTILSGWGLDLVWPTMAGAEADRVAIIDSVAVTHTRPIGSANYGFLKERGISALEERDALLEMHGITDPAIRIDAIELRGGFRFKGGSRLGRALVRSGYLATIARAYAFRHANRWDLRKRLQEALRSPVEFRIPRPRHRPAVDAARESESVTGAI
jgi:hypothetical protein